MSCHTQKGMNCRVISDLSKVPAPQSGALGTAGENLTHALVEIKSLEPRR